MNLIINNKLSEKKDLLFPVAVFLLQLLKNLRGFENIEYVVIGTLIIGILCKLINTSNHVQTKNIYYVLFMFAIIVISIINAKNISRTANNFLILFLIMIFFVIRTNNQDDSYIYKMFDQFKSFFIVIAVLNIYQIVLHKPILSNFLASNINPKASLFGNSEFRTMSVFANALVAGSGFLVGLIFSYYLIKDKLMKFFMIILMLWNIYSTQSRSTWLSLALIFFLILLIDITRTDVFRVRFNYNLVMIFPIILIIVVIVCVLLLHTSFVSEVISRFGDSLNVNNSTDISNLQRIGGLKLVLSNITGIHWIFGYGNGSVADLLESNRIVLSDFKTLDNQYFTILYENGILGIVFILIPLITSLKRLFFDKNINRYGNALYISCISLYFTFFFYEGIYWNTIGTIFAIFVSCIMFFNVGIYEKKSIDKPVMK